MTRSAGGASKASSARRIAPVRSKVAPVRIRRQRLCGPRIRAPHQSFQPECSAAMPMERLR